MSSSFPAFVVPSGTPRTAACRKAFFASHAACSARCAALKCRDSAAAVAKLAARPEEP